MSGSYPQDLNENFSKIELIEPNKPHVACVFLLDTSKSMNGAPIESLNKAINNLRMQKNTDDFVRNRVDIAIVEFNDRARVVQNFTPLSQMEPVSLTAGGRTAMGEGINMAIDMVKERNRFYDSMGTPCFKPWIFMITDGVPTDDVTSARQRIHEEESKGAFGKLKFWTVGVPGYSKDVITSLSKRCIALDEAIFDGIFDWMSDILIDHDHAIVCVDHPYLPVDAHVVPVDW